MPDLTEQPAEKRCDHFYAWCSPAGTSHGVRICQFCHDPEAADLEHLVATAKADALREAARDWQVRLFWPFGATTWLRRRAYKIDRTAEEQA